MLRQIAALLVVLGVLAVAGCSGDDEPASDSSTATTSASAVDTLIQSGLDQMAADDPAAAQTTFENVLEIDAGNPYAHYNLGLIAQLDGRDDQAVEHYDAALAADPNLVSALYNRAILAESTDLDAAAELYRRALAVDPELAYDGYPATSAAGAAVGNNGTAARYWAMKLWVQSAPADPALAVYAVCVPTS